jgi:hypothetical protein
LDDLFKINEFEGERRELAQMQNVCSPRQEFQEETKRFTENKSEK